MIDQSRSLVKEISMWTIRDIRPWCITLLFTANLVEYRLSVSMEWTLWCPPANRLGSRPGADWLFVDWESIETSAFVATMIRNLLSSAPIAASISATSPTLTFESRPTEISSELCFVSLGSSIEDGVMAAASSNKTLSETGSGRDDISCRSVVDFDQKSKVWANCARSLASDIRAIYSCQLAVAEYTACKSRWRFLCVRSSCSTEQCPL
jgi:hypothetical protein